MWRWTLNWGRIRDDIFVGSCPVTPTDIDRIRAETGITALMSVQTDACRATLGIDYREHRRHGQCVGVFLVNTPMRDFDPADQRLRLPAAVRTLHRLIASGHRVYLHCTAGVNRSPLVALGYLSFIEANSAGAALAIIQRGRPEAEPCWDAYAGCRDDLTRAYRDLIERRAWEIWQRNPARPAEANWFQAEREIIREVLLAGRGAGKNTVR